MYQIVFSTSVYLLFLLQPPPTYEESICQSVELPRNIFTSNLEVSPPRSIYNSVGPNTPHPVTPALPVWCRSGALTAQRVKRTSYSFIKVIGLSKVWLDISRKLIHTGQEFMWLMMRQLTTSCTHFRKRRLVRTWMFRTICGYRAYHRRITAHERCQGGWYILKTARLKHTKKGPVIYYVDYMPVCVYSPPPLLVSYRLQYLFRNAYQRSILSGVGEKCVCARTYWSRMWFSLLEDTFEKVPMRMSLTLSYCKEDRKAGLISLIYNSYTVVISMYNPISSLIHKRNAISCEFMTPSKFFWGGIINPFYSFSDKKLQVFSWLLLPSMLGTESCTLTFTN